MDLRGHGQSEAPLEAESYTNGTLWADDVASVIGELNLLSPTLVGWSYGGLIIGDYLRVYGDDDLAAVNLVSGAVGIGPSWFGPLIGPDFVQYAPLAASTDQAVSLKAIHALLHRMIVRQVSSDDIELAVGWSMLTPAEVRGHMINREEDFLPDFARLTKPLLVTFGSADTVVLPAMASAIHERCPRCHVSEFAETGHMPFVEDAARYNRELAQLAEAALVDS
jgi:pimeloyl-ACP methyl ester carboxylesterase